MTDTDKVIIAIVLVAIIAFAAIRFALELTDRHLSEAARERFEQLKKATLELEAATAWRQSKLGPVGFVHF